MLANPPFTKSAPSVLRPLILAVVIVWMGCNVTLGGPLTIAVEMFTGTATTNPVVLTPPGQPLHDGSFNYEGDTPNRPGDWGGSSTPIPIPTSGRSTGFAMIFRASAARARLSRIDRYG